MAVWLSENDTSAASTARIYDLGVTYLHWPDIMPSDIDREAMLVQLNAIAEGADIGFSCSWPTYEGGE